MTTICLAFTPQKNVLHVFKVELALYLKVQYDANLFIQ